MDNRSFCLLLSGLAILAGCEPTPPLTATSFGRFEGEVIASWDDDGRNMTLRDDFAYVDSQNRRWRAPRGSVVNGASIPAGFWSFIGGPFEGLYREASVVHDVACAEMTASSDDVHRMFYEACRCRGVDETTAKTMYYAVYHFGPRWEAETETVMEQHVNTEGQTVDRPVTIERMRRVTPQPPTPDEIDQVAALVVEENPAPHILERTDREMLRTRPRRGSYRGKTPPGNGTNRPGDNYNRTASPALQYRREPFSDFTEQRRSDGRDDAVNSSWSERGRASPTQIRPELTREEQEWAQQVVRRNLQRAGSPDRPAEFAVERTSDGYRVQVRYFQLDERGQPVAYADQSTVHLSRDGRVLESTSRRPAQIR